MYIDLGMHGDKSFRTVWTELAQEFPEVFNHCAEQTFEQKTRWNCISKSLRSALGKVMQHLGWVVHQRSFVAGARSLNEAEFKENLEYVKVPSARIDSIRTKLAMTIFDEYANILKGMYSIRFNGRPDSGGTSARPDTGSSDHGEAPTRPDRDPIRPLINSLTAWQPNKFRKRKERGSKEKEI